MYENEIVMRLLLALAIMAGGAGVYWLTNRLVLARARESARHLEWPRPGKLVLLYFTTPTCAPCKTVQRPAIQSLLSHTGDQLEVVEIDASQQPELASKWGVLSVPTTFVIDAQGQPRYVNHGVTPAEKLLQQVQGLITE
jgi:thiol-disulfide isomerase/thioredoxin